MYRYNDLSGMFFGRLKVIRENGYNENAPKGECTIDRIDPFGNYEPSNCRWVSMAEQAKKQEKYGMI